jgi:FKBP-type peptidyl-prolyl cis-trans isomerase
MKKVLILALLPVLFYGCLKSGNSTTCTNIDPSEEASQIQSYCIANRIDYIIDSSGIYYQIIDLGEGNHPTLTSNVTFAFTAKFLNGSILSQTTAPYTESMANVIEGWQIGLKKIAKKGHIKLVVPSSLAYGCVGSLPNIPPNSIIYYDITLVDIN